MNQIDAGELTITRKTGTGNLLPILGLVVAMMVTLWFWTCPILARRTPAQHFKRDLAQA